MTIKPTPMTDTDRARVLTVVTRLMKQVSPPVNLTLMRSECWCCGTRWETRGYVAELCRKCKRERRA